MKIYHELDLATFEAWNGAKPTLKRIINEGKCEQLESILEAHYPDGMTEDELSYLLWHDAELVFEWLGIRSEDVIRNCIDVVKQEIAELKEEYRGEVEELRYEATEREWNDGTLQRREEELWMDKYSEDMADLEEKLCILEEELHEALEVYD